MASEPISSPERQKPSSVIIAEGAGRWSQADSAKHHKIARGEAMECAASLDVLKLRKLVTPERYERGIQLLEDVVAMLTKRV